MSCEALHGRRILVVEDDSLIALDLVLKLREVGAEIAGPARSLRAAVRLADAEPLAAAVLDIRLGEDEVWPAARRLAGRGVPFLFCTGHYDGRELAADWPGTLVMAKPASSDSVLAALATLVSTASEGGSSGSQACGI
jgi:DNA-binding response OmpR family regulator